MGTRLILSEADFTEAAMDIRPTTNVEINIDKTSYAYTENVSFTVTTDTEGYEKLAPIVIFNDSTLFTYSSTSPWKYDIVLHETYVGKRLIVAKQATDSTDSYQGGETSVKLEITSDND